MMTHVNTTTDYDQFKVIGGNRSINDLHLKRLSQSIEEKQLIVPIIVNEKMEVIDGQHRLQALKQLGKTVHYIICKGYGIEEVQRLNTNAKNRQAIDYVDGYCELGNQNYIDFRNYFMEHGVTITMGITMTMGDNGKNWIDFKNGKLKGIDYQKANILGEQFTMFKKYYKGYNCKRFLKAFMKVREHPEYNHTEMMNKLEFQSLKMVDATTEKQYILLLEDIYNYKRRDKVRFL